VNYLSATSANASFNPDLELLPLDSSYTQNKTVDTIVKWAVVIIVIGLIVTVIVIAVKRFRAYINSPDPET
jgi:hypothetical protein